MSNPIYSVPKWAFYLLKRSVGYVRRAIGTKKDRPPMELHVDATIEELRAILGNQYFTNNWELSWHYRGTDLNMRRPLRQDDYYEWYQLHVRGWDKENGGVHLEVHYDLEPTEYPYYHLNPPKDANLNPVMARTDVTNILDSEGIAYEQL